MPAGGDRAAPTVAPPRSPATDCAIVLRPYVPGDLDACLAIWRDASAVGHPFLTSAMMAADEPAVRDDGLPGAAITIALVDGAPAGFIALIGDHMGGLFVAPHHRGAGIGRALVEHAAAAVGRLSVEVYEANDAARRFYARLGFRFAGRRETDDRDRPFPLLTLARGDAAADWPSVERWRTGGGPLVKICGLTRPDLAAAAVAASADMIGLVHFAPSPRHLAVEAAAEVAAAAAGAYVVALTVDADDRTLDALVAAARPQALQLHGSETPARVAEVAARYGLPVAKAYGVANAEDIAAVGAHEALAVLDAKPPKDADRPGGHGAAFEWSLLAALPAGLPYMLSGGLHPDNVAAAVAATRPYAVDVSSGVETGGMKDPAKVAAFIAACRAG